MAWGTGRAPYNRTDPPMTARHLALPAIAQFGRFDILGRLAIGGMAEIFLAREKGPGRGTRCVVLKRILPHVSNDPRFVEMFLHEAELAMNLTHPNLCAIYEFGERDGEYFIAMEWVQGVSITEMHKALFDRGDGGIPHQLVARIAAEVAEALEFAHHAKDAEGRPMKLVHRDVTPDNVMVSFDGKVKLLDFGVAKAETQRQKTDAGMLKGKFAYMSPEQYQGQTLDGRADVFSLGACMYEAMTGMALFHRASEYETMGAIVGDDPAPRVRALKPQVPKGLDNIVAQALAKSRDKRFSSAGALHQALERYLVDQGLVVRPQDVSHFVVELCSAQIQSGSRLDSKPELWTRETAQSSAHREALEDTISRDLIDATDEFAAQNKQRSGLVSVALATVVLGLLALVLYTALNPGG